MIINIFDFDDPVEYLCSVIDEKKRVNSRYSLRSWADQLGYKSAGYLSEVMRRAKPVSLDLVRRISERELLSSDQSAYLEALVVWRDKTAHLKRAFIAGGNFDSTSAPNANIDYDHFTVIAEWLHLVLFEMTKLKDFDGDIATLVKKFAGRVSYERVMKSLSRLEKTGFITQASGRNIKRKKDHIVALQHTPSEYVRAHHKQMMELAMTALTEQSIEQRYLQSSTVAIKKSDLPAARELIAEFHRKIASLECQGSADCVYQLNSQFFKHV